MAEGLGTGLQNRLQGFKSLCHLQFPDLGILAFASGF